MRTYFLRNGRKVSGPFTLSMLHNQAFSTVTEVRYEGLNDWTAPDQLPELQHIISPAPSTPDDRSTNQEPGTTEGQVYAVDSNKVPREVSVVAVALVIALSISTVGWLRQPDKRIEPIVSIPHKAVPTEIAIKHEEVKPAPVMKQTSLVAPQVDKEKKARKNWVKTIRVVNSSYGYGAIGGINDLSLVFINGTDYPMDEIVAKVTYIKANGKEWKSKLVTLQNLAPHSQKKQEVPKVFRGKTIKISVYKIRSKKMQFCYEEGKSSPNADDPFHCR